MTRRPRLAAAPHRPGTATLVAALVVVLAPVLAHGLTFAPCQEADQAAFECATVTVPLDYLAQAGAIQLHVQRLIRPVQPAGVLIALAGGPGQSATSVSELFSENLGPLLESRQLVIFDQRGTGLSGALDCDLPDGEMPSARRCARRLGSDRRFYATADSVRDLDAVREAIGAERVFVYGISYGTLVAAQYGRTFPGHVERIVLDSSLPPEPDPVERPTFAAIPRVLAELCSAGACAGITTDPNRDLDRLVRRARRSLRAAVLDSRGDRRRRRVRPDTLYNLLLAGDLGIAMRLFVPAAMVTGLAGDTDSLGRLLSITNAIDAGAHPVRGDDDDLRENSGAILQATPCLDTPFPWASEAPVTARRHAMRAFFRDSVAPGSFAPFTSREAANVTEMGSCLHWPGTSRFDALTAAPFAPVPTLILEGAGDLRTPVEGTDELLAVLPDGQRVVVPAAGHSLLTSAECVQEVLARFDRDEDPSDACAGNRLALPVQPIPPRSLAALDPISAAGRPGRTANAARLTLRDAVAAVTAFFPLNFPGLRHGSGRPRGDPSSFTLMLEGYSLVPGVRIDGELIFDGRSLGGRFEVSGEKAAPGTIELADGRITGTLGGVAIVAEVQTPVTLRAGQLRAWPLIR